MRRRRLFWQLYPSYLAIAIVSVAAVGWLGARTARDVVYAHAANDLEAIARFVGDEIAPFLASRDYARVESAATNLARASRSRITIILPDGTVIGESARDPAGMDAHDDRREVMAARAGRVGTSVRYSRTLGSDMIYVAVPCAPRGRIAGIVRASMPMMAVNRVYRDLRMGVILGGIAVAFLVAATSYVVARRIARPLEDIRATADRYAGGDFGAPLPSAGSREIAEIGEAMSRMAEQLDERIRTLARQRNEQQAVLASMIEGVVAVDTEERIIGMNRAAGRLLGIEPADAIGRIIQEVVRNVDLQRFVGRSFGSDAPVEGDVVLPGDTPRYLHVHGTVLRDARGRNIGVLVVLNDVTRLVRLERVRSEFVANVSHELRTPITSIKGFVETLLDGAVDNPTDTRRFLAIIARQVDRLHAIVEDLLSLSRIEQESERGAIELAEGQVCAVIRAAVQLCQVKADAKDIHLVTDCAIDLRAPMNAPLLEQAVVNLIDNAIKYSEHGGVVEIAGGPTESGIEIRVRDEGCGIAEQHHARIFERFYRVDRARSRELGGTGLGLAIVKHIAQAHGGRVAVASAPGKGSTFTIFVPAA